MENGKSSFFKLRWERLTVIWKMERREQECVAFISHWICRQPSFLAERKWGSGGRERGFERVKMGMGGGSFSPVWPLSHSNSSLATWMPVPLSSPTAQDLTHSLPDYTSSELEKRRLQTDAEPDDSKKTRKNRIEHLFVSVFICTLIKMLKTSLLAS